MNLSEPRPPDLWDLVQVNNQFLPQVRRDLVLHVAKSKSCRCLSNSRCPGPLSSQKGVSLVLERSHDDSPTACNPSDLSCMTTQQGCLVRSQEADITYIRSSNSSLRHHLTTASSQTNQTPRQANRIRSTVSPHIGAHFPRTNTCSLQSVLLQTMTSVLSSLSNAIHHLHQPEWVSTTTDKAKPGMSSVIILAHTKIR